MLFLNTNKIDSLKQVACQLQRMIQQGAELLYRLGLAYNRTDYKVSRVLFDSVLRIVARNKHFKRLEADTYLEIGNLGFDHGDYPLSIEYYTKATEKYNALSGHVKASGLAAIYNNVGAILSLTNDWESAQKYYLKSLNEYEKLNDITRMVTVYFNIAFVFSDMDEWNKSYEHMLKSFHLSKQSENKSQNLQACCTARDNLFQNRKN